MDGQCLAAALAERLQAVVPAGLCVVPEGGDVKFFWDSAPDLWGVAGVQRILDQDGDPAQHLTNCCYSVLSMVQDEIAEATTVPWPGQDRTMPLPGVKITAHEVRLWYGDQDLPTIALAPIPIIESDLRSPGTERRIVEGEMYGAPVPGSWPGGRTGHGPGGSPVVRRHRSGKYRWRTWLRRRLPSRPLVYLLVPKGRGDCGEHDWYKATDAEDHCYHCRAIRSPSEF